MNPNQKLYNLKVRLQKDLPDVECWNCTDGSTGTLLAGDVIMVCHPNDATHTTIQVKLGGLKLNPKPDGSEPQNKIGYRFIIPNKTLREATGLPYPDTGRDLVGDIMAFEAGEMDVEQARSFLTDLNERGLLSKLQGSYGRAARQLGVI